MTTVSTAVARAGVRRPVAGPLAAGAVLAAGCLVLGAVDPAGGPPVCPFKALTGLDCPGCGGTRAVHQLLTGHLAAAVDLNLVAVVALPFLAWTVFAWLTKAFGGPPLRTLSLPGRWVWVVLGAVVAFWVLRNLPLAPFHWMSTTA